MQQKSENHSQEDADPVEVTTTDDALAPLLKQVESLQGEVQQQKENFLRARADLDNFRKRSAREREELQKFATANLVEKLLPIIDNFKLGLESIDVSEEAQNHIEGFWMVLSQLESTLKDIGLEAITPEGDVFDPNMHACVAQQPSSDVEENHVMQVVRVGYTLNGKLLRPASVIVSSGNKESA